ncbi:MAG: hypothetical protein KAS32_29470 [Candidatus Peribacteraceae bacterium]|nr:hypothetical protein [Candidatus Peribacteraceae bacterium]
MSKRRRKSHSSYPLASYFTQKVECHNGSLHLFTWKGINFWGGGSSRNMSLEGMDLVIDCADVAEPMITLHGVDTKIFPFSNASARIVLNWPDMGVPDLVKADWTTILKGIEKMKKAKKDGEFNVLACCVGGHGRTGTALSILAALTVLKGKKQCPVTYVRDNYCKEVVETESQKEYIEEITGMEVKAKIDSYVYAGYAGRSFIDTDDDVDTADDSNIAAWRRGDFIDY